MVAGAWAKADPPTELPTVSASDNGDLLTVVGGAWAKADPPTIPALSDDTPAALGTASAGTGKEASRDDHVHAKPDDELPAVSASDNGDILKVVGGAWAKADPPTIPGLSDDTPAALALPLLELELKPAGMTMFTLCRTGLVHSLLPIKRNLTELRQAHRLTHHIPHDLPR